MLKYIEIKTKNINHNISQIRKVIGREVKLLAVVKSDAYGHGLAGVSKAIEKNIDFFGVDDFEEALELRNNDITRPILILGAVEKRNLKEAAANYIRVPVYNKRSLEAVLPVPGLKIHLKVNTGLNRLGLEPKEAVEFAKKIDDQPKLTLEGVWSHFANSSSLDGKYAKKQLSVFEEVKKRLSACGIKPEIFHMSNSGGIVNLKSARFDMVRSGSLIYGYPPSGNRNLSLKPALNFKSQIVQIRKIKKRESIGYDLTYRAGEDRLIAVLPVGYKDGYPRHLSNKGQVIIGGQRCPVVGRICMRMMMVDISDLENVSEGDEVILIGEQQSDRIDAREIGEKIRTTEYEILSRIDSNIRRIYE